MIYRIFGWSILALVIGGSMFLGSLVPEITLSVDTRIGLVAVIAILCAYDGDRRLRDEIERLQERIFRLEQAKRRGS